MIYNLNKEHEKFVNLYKKFRKSRYKSLARYLYDLENNHIKICPCCGKEAPYLLKDDNEGAGCCSRCFYQTNGTCIKNKEKS